MVSTQRNKIEYSMYRLCINYDITENDQRCILRVENVLSVKAPLTGKHDIIRKEVSVRM